MGEPLDDLEQLRKAVELDLQALYETAQKEIAEEKKMWEFIFSHLYVWQIGSYITPLRFASSINLGWIKGYVQFSTNVSVIKTFSISLCNSFSNVLISAKHNIP